MARLSTKTPAKTPAVKPVAAKAATAKPAAKPATAGTAKSKVAARPAGSSGKSAVANPNAQMVAEEHRDAVNAKKATETAKRAPAGATKTTFTPEERYRMVAEAAYYHAERHGFKGDPVLDWIAAEKQIEALLSGKKKK